MARRIRWSLALLVPALACGVSFEDIPADALVHDLSDAENEAMCAWTESLAASLPGADGAEALDCGDTRYLITFELECRWDRSTPENCGLQVGPLRDCFPKWVDKIASAPCARIPTSTQASWDLLRSISACHPLSECIRYQFEN